MRRLNLTALKTLVPVVLCVLLGSRAAVAMPQSSAPVMTAPAVGLTPVQSPLGFAISVPAGWIQKPVPQAPNVLVLSPPDADSPSIYILPALPVSDMRFQAILSRCSQAIQRNPLFGPDAFTGCIQPAMNSQLVDSRQAWSPDAAFGAILNMLGSGQTRFGKPRLTAVSQTSARFSVPAASMGREVEDWGLVSTVYLNNPLLAQPNGASGTTTLAFVYGCSAPPAQAQSFAPVCAAVLRSFQPRQEWVNRLVQEISRSYAQEYQTLIRMGTTMVDHFGRREQGIAQFGANMQQLQYAAYQAIQTVALQAGLNGIAALGGPNDQVVRCSKVGPGIYPYTETDRCTGVLPPLQ
jgi:hypothetical protein